MQLRARRLVATFALASGFTLIPSTPPAHATVQDILNGGAPYAVYVVKDLGGGAYWNVTTQTMYVLQAGSALLISGAQTTADLVATLAANGRDLLLLVNGAVLVPVQNALR